MGTTSEKLTYLNTTKGLIKDKLNLGGANITTEPFRAYSSKLMGIYKDFLAHGTDELWNNWNKVSGTGTELSLNNTMEGKMKVDLKGNTQQNGTPTPDTPVDVQVVSGDNTIKVEGKNLFDKDNANVIIGYINGSGVISSSNDNRTIWLPIKQNTDYAIKMTAVGITTSTSGDDVKIGLTKTQPTIGDQTNLIYSQSTAAGVNYTHEKTFNSGEYNYVVIKIGNTSRTNYGESIATLQICIGNVIPTTYTPYVSQTYPISLGNIELCKIGTYQDKIFKSSGKNLFTNIVYKDNYLIDAQGNEVSSDASCIWQKIKVKPNTTYTLSYTSTDYSFAQRVSEYNSSEVFIQRNVTNQSPYTFTTTSTTEYINLSGLKTDINIMINEGTTALDYEPYGKVWYLNKQIGKVVLNGSENWAANSSTSGTKYRYWLNSSNFTNVFTNIIVEDETGLLGKVLCDYETQALFSNTAYGKFAINVSQNVNSCWFLMNFDDSAITSTQDFKTWLSTHNTEVYYVLATPTYEEITDSSLLSQLEALAYSYEGTTNISQVNDDLASELDVVALEDM